MEKENILIEKCIKCSYIKTYSDGTHSEHWENRAGELHSYFNQPAFIWYLKNGEPYLIQYFNNGNLHRSSNHATFIYYDKEKETNKSWHKNGKFIKGFSIY
jgi:hypothetical protein